MSREREREKGGEGEACGMNDVRGGRRKRECERRRRRRRKNVLQMTSGLQKHLVNHGPLVRSFLMPGGASRAEEVES